MLTEPAENPGTSRLTLEIQDWGCGFVPEEKIGDYSRVGLQGMIERVHLMGGSIIFHSTPGKGTIVCATFPLLSPRIDGIHGDLK